MDSITTALIDANPEDTQTSEKMNINAAIASEGESNDTDDNGGDASLPTTTTGEPIPDCTPNQAHKQKARLPPLPPSNYKIVFPVSQAAHITATESDAFTLRIRNEQNLAVLSTPKEELAECIRRITALQLCGKEYQVYAYMAAPDMSGEGVATQIDTNIKATYTLTLLKKQINQVVHMIRRVTNCRHA
ncbi:hypothetical protein HPB49_020578 [Dermacentor silvarum]|uniref:Uncharacterized protein n=1 Tax=Dermacentor silvarum TaxID=543639 RepID=A0ACB8C5B7_DERSI|nr:hypothetical protein HPB49_020578 [Dermacentor silvarum]